MPFSTGAIHVAQPLLDLCIAYQPSEDDYIRNEFFPKKAVQHDTDKVWTVSKADTLRLYDLDVTDVSSIPIVTYRPSGTVTFTCQPFAAATVITPHETKNADVALRHEMRQTRQALTALGIRMEYLAVNSTLRNSSVLTNYDTLSGGTLWDNFSSASSSPIENLQAAISLIRVRVGRGRRKIESGGGRIKIAMSEFTALTLCQHPNVLSRLTWNPSGTGAVLTQKILAEILGIREEDIIITAAQYTSSQQGQTNAFKLFMGSDVVVAYVDDANPENDQCLGHEFAFDGLSGEDPYLVRRWRDENAGYAGVDKIGVACVTTFKPTNVDAAFLFKTVLDTTNTDRYGSFLD